MASYFQQADEFLKARLIERLQATDAKTVVTELRAHQPGTFANKLIAAYLQTVVVMPLPVVVVPLPKPAAIIQTTRPSSLALSASSSSANRRLWSSSLSDSLRRPRSAKTVLPIRRNTDRALQLVAAATSSSAKSVIGDNVQSTSVFRPVRLSSFAPSSSIRASSAWLDPPALVLPPSVSVSVPVSSSTVSYLSPPSSPIVVPQTDASPPPSPPPLSVVDIKALSEPIDSKTAIDEPKSDRELRKRKSGVAYSDIRRRSVTDADFFESDVDRPTKKRSTDADVETTEPARDLLTEAKLGGYGDNKGNNRGTIIANAITTGRLRLWRSGTVVDSASWSTVMTALNLQPSAVGGRRYARSIGDFLRAVFRSRGMSDNDITAFDRQSAAKKRWIGVALS